MSAVAEISDFITKRQCLSSSVIITKDQNAETLGYESPSLLINEHKRVKQESGAGSVILVFDGIMTDNQVDRDGDIMVPSGADIDPAHPLLWNHNSSLPVGGFNKLLAQDNSIVKGQFRIVGTELGQDAAMLVEAGCMRLSIGFKPTDYEEIRDSKGNLTGFKVKKFLIVETSLVPVPANSRAIILAFQRKQFKSISGRQFAVGVIKTQTKSHTPTLPTKQAASDVVRLDVFEEQFAKAMLLDDPSEELMKLRKQLSDRVFVVETALKAVSNQRFEESLLSLGTS